MNAFDIVLTVGIVAIIVLETVRGFGRTFYDCLALFAALWVASTFFLPLSNALHLSANVGANQADAFGIAFFALVAVGLFVSRLVYGNAMFSLGIFDKLFGGVAGIAVAVLLAHGLVRTIDLCNHGMPNPQGYLAGSSVGEQALNFDSYHDFMGNLAEATGGKRTVDVSN